MKTFGLVIAALAFAGCAATSGQTTAPKKVASTDSDFPTRISADGLDDALTDYDQLISRRHDGEARARVNVCVKPSGQVSRASVVNSSGIAGFDRAVAAAIAQWKYERATAANGKTRCKNIKVVYQTNI